MGKYWLKIGLGAFLIFMVGFAIISAGRQVKSSIESDRDLTIPLGSFIPFKLDGQEIGKLRSLVIHRSSPKVITGFDVRSRVTDSAAFARLQACKISVTDATRFDQHSTFFCLPSDSGYQAFGEVRVDLRLPGGTQTLVQPLYLSESAVRDFARQAADSVSGVAVDSLAAQIRETTRDIERVYRDSALVQRLDKQARDMQRKADSIRNRVLPPKPQAP